MLKRPAFSEKAGSRRPVEVVETSAALHKRYVKGMHPVAWGDTASSETQFTSWLYNGVAGLDEVETRSIDRKRM